MSTPPGASDLRPSPGVRGYELLCLAALLVLLPALHGRGLGVWGLLPVGVGGLALLTRWRAGPVLVLLALALVLAARALGLTPYTLARVVFWSLVGVWRYVPVYSPLIRGPGRAGGPPDLADWVVAGAVLAYCAGHYRLQGVWRHLLPPDPRRRHDPPGPPGARRQRGRGPVVRQRRSPRLVTPREVARLALAAPVWAGLGLVGWSLLLLAEPALDLPAGLWRGILIGWLLGLGAILTTSALGYLGLRRLTPAAAALFLQDTLWRETRREQQRLGRWLAWARLRQRRRKEGG